MSHFSFTRNIYDSCASGQKTQESQASFEYATDSSIVESQAACFVGSAPFQQNPFRSVPTHNIDAESELRGQNYNLTRCASEMFQPGAKPIQTVTLNECKDDKLVPQYTRNNKACNLSGITINRFHPLCDDLQDLSKIHNNTVIGSNTRLQIKDAFSAKQLAKKE
jgi:hypothetical protein